MLNHLLEFVGLFAKRYLISGDLSFGEQKLLEFAMALMNEPKVLLLDEPTAGINPTLINGLIDRLKRANQEFGITLFVIEHNMRVVMNLADSIYCLAHGEMLSHGTPGEIKKNQKFLFYFKPLENILRHFKSYPWRIRNLINHSWFHKRRS